MANSVLCVKCGKWIHGRCAKGKRVTPRLGRDVVCERCKNQVNGFVGPVEELILLTRFSKIWTFLLFKSLANALLVTLVSTS